MQGKLTQKSAMSLFKQIVLNPITIEPNSKNSELKRAFGKINCYDGSARILKVVYNNKITPLKILQLSLLNH